jgi:hypothetical protein
MRTDDHSRETEAGFFSPLRRAPLPDGVSR